MKPYSYIWVIEVNNYKHKDWKIWSCHDLRKEAREQIKICKEFYNKNFRLRKYVQYDQIKPYLYTTI